MNQKIPFFIVRNFISPLFCESIINDLGVNKLIPSMDQSGNPEKIPLTNKLNETRIIKHFDNYVERLEDHFGFKYKGTYTLIFEYYPDGYKASPAKSDGYTKRNHEWVKTSGIDFTGILFLNNYQDSPPFDPYFEVNGGLLAFPTFDMSIKPERGTFIAFPTAPNFVHSTTSINAGELCQIRFHIRSEKPYEYNMNNFNNNYKTWNL